MDREAWWAAVDGIAKSQKRLSDFHTHTHTHTPSTEEDVNLIPGQRAKIPHALLCGQKMKNHKAEVIL